MAITKTQINYLEEKLKRMVKEKVEAFKVKNNILAANLDERLLEALKEGEIELKSNRQIKELVLQSPKQSYYYRISFYLEDILNEDDVKSISELHNAECKRVAEYTDKLVKAQSDILDKIVLDGIDIDTAFAEFDKL